MALEVVVLLGEWGLWVPSWLPHLPPSPHMLDLLPQLDYWPRLRGQPWLFQFCPIILASYPLGRWGLATLDSSLGKPVSTSRRPHLNSLQPSPIPSSAPCFLLNQMCLLGLQHFCRVR